MKNLRTLIEDTEADYDKYFTNGWNAAKKLKNPQGYEAKERFKKVQSTNGPDWIQGYLAFIEKRDFPTSTAPTVLRAKGLKLTEEVVFNQNYADGMKALGKRIVQLTGLTLKEVLEAEGKSISFTDDGIKRGKLYGFEDYFSIVTSPEEVPYWEENLKKSLPDIDPYFPNGKKGMRVTINLILPMETIKESVDSNPLDGKKKKQVTDMINKILKKYTDGQFSDTSWEPINKMRADLTNNGIPLEALDGSGRYEKENGIDIRKVWKYKVPFQNQNDRADSVYISITASGTGPVSDPLQRYDVVAYAT